MSDSERPILIKKVKKVVGGGHHGGAWKVAYADFVTAMMAFFLLMWLINTTSPEQKAGIASYFSPANVAESSSGSGGILGGTGLNDDGAQSSGSPDTQEVVSPKSQDDPSDAAPATTKPDPLAQAKKKREDAAFESAAQSLRQSLQEMPELAELSKNIIVDQTPEGLRIQLVDQEGRALFADGATTPNSRGSLLLRATAKILRQLPNRITISGHTAANSDLIQSDSDWALSTARANSSRKVILGAGVPTDRIYQISGKANSEPLYPDDPTLPGNRRISILLLREAPVLPFNHSF